MNPGRSAALPAGWPLAPARRGGESAGAAADSTYPLLTVPGSRPGVEAAPRRARRKLWDLPVRLHCPLVGTCLDAGALRRLAEKLNFRDRDRLGDYDLHVQFVSAASGKNTVSIATQKVLEKQHAAAVRRFARIRCRDALEQAWRDALAGKDVPGAMWATLTHTLCDDGIRTRIYEDIHMLSHQLGAGQRVDLNRHAQTCEALARLRKAHDAFVNKSRRQIEERDHRIEALNADLDAAEQSRRRESQDRAALQRELDALRATDSAAAIDDLQRGMKACARQIRALTRERDEWRNACDSERTRTGALQSERDTLAADFAALERLVLQRLGEADDPGVDDDLPATDLHGRQVLYVGGRNRLIERYRALVERCNGHFSHHDGGREDNRSRLEAMMSAVDTVLCATDCVSHDACLRLKRFCKRHDKQYVMLHSSGLSSLARAIESLAA